MSATISFGSLVTVQAMHHDIKLDAEIGDWPFALVCVPENGIHGVLGFETVDEARSAAAAQAADMIASGLKAPTVREVTLGGAPSPQNAPVVDGPVQDVRGDASSRLDRFRNVVTLALGFKQKQLA